MHTSSNYHTPIPSHSIKLDMLIEEFFDDGNAFAGEEGTEDGANADAVESVEDGEGQDDRGWQAAEVEGSFDHLVFFSCDLGEIAGEGIRRDDGQHAVVGQADTEADQDESCDEIQAVHRQGVWQRLDPRIVDVNHFTESQSDYEREEIAGTERLLQHHQCDDQQGLKNVIPCTETEEWKRRAEDERHGRNGWDSKSALSHQIHPEGIDDENDQKCSLSRKSNFFYIHTLRTLLSYFTHFHTVSISEQGLL